MKHRNDTIRHALRHVALLGMLLILVTTVSCDDSDDNAAPAAKIQLMTSTSLGNYLADAEGNALYYFSKDVAGANTCTGGCATLWPTFFEAGLTADMLGEGLSIDDFGTVTAAAGEQTTYKGWPLYYYAPGGVRETPAQTTGEAVGGVWFVAKTDYTIMLGNTQLVGHDGKKYKSDYTEGEGVVTYFTDAHGRALYAFAVDKKNKNNFTNGDGAHDAVWPVFGDAMASIPSTLDKSLFGTITVQGATQLTYKGWPIYYFGNDGARGENKGISFPKPGIWPVVVKDAPLAPTE